MATSPDPAVPPSGKGAPGPAAEQRALDVAMRVGVALGAIGLVTTAVIVTLYFAGAELPGTWAYGLAMLAPLGFGIILVTLVSVAVRRRRAGLDDRPGASGRPTQ